MRLDSVPVVLDFVNPCAALRHVVAGSCHPRPKFIIDRLQELGQPRIDDMNASGVDKQILSLTSPGVQVCPRSIGRDLQQ